MGVVKEGGKTHDPLCTRQSRKLCPGGTELRKNDLRRGHLLSVQDDGDGIDRFGTEAAALAENLRGEPVLIMADLFGGSPFMTLLSAFRDTEYVCLTGFNLAMVIQMLQYDGDDLHELAEDIASIGKDVSIRLIPKIIPEEEQND